MLRVFAWKHPSGYTNFGDELNAPLLSAMVGFPVQVERNPRRTQKLLAIGTVLAGWASRPFDIVWGSGSWGEKIPPRLDIRAVRGPLTADRVAAAGYTKPAVFGDPAMLVPRFFPFPVGGGGTRYVPHHTEELHDVANIIDVRRPPLEVVEAIASSDFIVAGSLHGLIVAEAYGVPAALYHSAEVSRHSMKYADYLLSTGRQMPAKLGDYRSLSLGDRLPPPVKPDLDALLNAFPLESFLHEGNDH